MSGLAYVERIAGDLRGSGLSAATAQSLALGTLRKWAERNGDAKRVLREAELKLGSAPEVFATVEEQAKLCAAATHRASVGEGLLASLTDAPKKGMAFATAKALLEGKSAKVSLDSVEPTESEVGALVERLRASMLIDRGLEEFSSAPSQVPYVGPPATNFAPDTHFNPDQHPRDKLGKFTALIEQLAVGGSPEGVHAVDLPSGVSVEKTTIGTHFWVRGKNGAAQKFKSAEDAALAGLLANAMGGKVLTEVELRANTDEFLGLVEAPLGPHPRDTGGNQAGQAGAPKGRGGGKSPKPGTKTRSGGQANSGFEAQHPRGRGGVWIKKGAGTGAGGPQPEVAQLQRRLQQLGYGPGAADGKFGPVTEAALSKFQTDYGLAASGQMDPATLATLQQPPAQKLAQIQAQNAQLATLPNAQGVVSRSGRGTGTAAGGSRARSSATGGGGAGSVPGLNPGDPNSVKAFQQAHGLAVDGIIGPQTQAAIRQASQQQTRTGGRSSGRSTGRSSGRSTGHTTGSTRGTGHTKATRSKNLQRGTGLSGKPDKRVKKLQQELQQLGYDVSGVDGRFGKSTEAAVRQLQKKLGLNVDGVVGPKTLRAIKRALRGQQRGAKAGGLNSADVTLHASAFFTWADRIEEAVATRTGAEGTGDVDTFIRARAEELAARRGLEEWFGRGGGKVVHFDPAQHPRDRRGKFSQVLNHLKTGQSVHLPDGSKVTRKADNSFLVNPVSGVESSTPHVGEAINRIVGDAGRDWRSPNEHSQHGVSELRKLERATQAGVMGWGRTPKKSAPSEPQIQAKLDKMKYGDTITIGKAEVKRGRFGWTVDGKPWKAEDVAYTVKLANQDKKPPPRRATTDTGKHGTRIHPALLASEERPMVDLHLRLLEATADRLLAEWLNDTTEWVRARAIEEEARHQIDESDVALEERLFLRDRAGRFRAKLAGLRVGGSIRLRDGTLVRKVMQPAKDPKPENMHFEVGGDAQYGTKNVNITTHGGKPVRVVGVDSAIEKLKAIGGLRESIEESVASIAGGGGFGGPHGGGISFDPGKHPRDRNGKFLEVLGKITGTKGSYVLKGEAAKTHVDLPSGVRVEHAGIDRFHVFDGKGGKQTVHGKSRTVKVALAAHDTGGLSHLHEAADTAAKASTHEPVGHGGRNWITSMGEQLPAYIQHIANDLIEKRGKSESNAVQMAIGIVKRWAKGLGNVKPETVAAAKKAVAEWEALKAKNKASKVNAAFIEFEDAVDDAYWLVEASKTYSADARDKATTMADNSFPIDNEADLKRAISSVGRAKDTAKARRWIIKRAKDLNATNLLPNGWDVQEAATILPYVVANQGGMVANYWDPKKHPRTRQGKFAGVMSKLTGRVKDAHAKHLTKRLRAVQAEHAKIVAGHSGVVTAYTIANQAGLPAHMGTSKLSKLNAKMAKIDRKLAKLDEALNEELPGGLLTVRMLEGGMPLQEAIDAAAGVGWWDDGLPLIEGLFNFDTHKHPRDRLGKFVDVLGKLKAGNDVKLPHGTAIHPVDSTLNKYTVTDATGMKRHVIGAHPAAGLGLLLDRTIQKAPSSSAGKADPGPRGVEHFPQADAINAKFTGPNAGLTATTPPRYPPLHRSQSVPDIHAWPTTPEAAGKMDTGVPSQAQVARATHQIPEKVTAANIKYVTAKYHGVSDQQLSERMRAIEDPVSYQSEVLDLALEMKRRGIKPVPLARAPRTPEKWAAGRGPIGAPAAGTHQWDALSTWHGIPQAGTLERGVGGPSHQELLRREHAAGGARPVASRPEPVRPSPMRPEAPHDRWSTGRTFEGFPETGSVEVPGSAPSHEELMRREAAAGGARPVVPGAVDPGQSAREGAAVRVLNGDSAASIGEKVTARRVLGLNPDGSQDTLAITTWTTRNRVRASEWWNGVHVPLGLTALTTSPLDSGAGGAVVGTPPPASVGGGAVSAAKLREDAIAAVADPDAIQALTIAEIANNIHSDWGPGVTFAASSYLDGMRTSRPLWHNPELQSVVRQFLANSGEWTGPVADVVKPELARRLAGCFH